MTCPFSSLQQLPTEQSLLALHLFNSSANIFCKTEIVCQMNKLVNFIKINNDWYLMDNVRFLEVFDQDKKGRLGFS